MRHFTQHKNFPPITATLKLFSSDTNSNNKLSEQILVLRKNDLMKWGKWRKKRKGFIISNRKSKH